ncbi:2OG-Fe dioxygenase family protein [Solimonas marina]|uniref:2OG-Fe dioxygenase family protein n=1 Tax=Solimonas marina TaxID=2714601 RepID=A0A970B4S8_9GAMM|nr:2OG-Fe dioxygenase family protein [Solimonas marina]NKF20855.1 2OG-Fe dioxygenase family protein [Solimonas marina]
MSVSPDAVVPADLVAALRRDGHVFVHAAELQPRLASDVGLSDWPQVAQSWDDMPLDAYMADGGRYRRRRYGVFSAGRDGAIARESHQPHWQSTDYNRLNGGIARWFEPIADDIGASASIQAVLQCCRGAFNALAPDTPHWHIEMHQFRIEAALDEAGQPTPEGIHRDGVDYVMVLLVRRENIACGTTTIHAPDGALLGSFTLTDTFDATLLDDHRVFHGVTPVVPIDARAPAFRDVLVVTFRGADAPTDPLP